MTPGRLQIHVPIRLALKGADLREVRAGAFATYAEAVKVLDHWRTLGYTDPMAIRTLPVYGSVEEWLADPDRLDDGPEPRSRRPQPHSGSSVPSGPRSMLRSSVESP